MQRKRRLTHESEKTARTQSATVRGHYVRIWLFESMFMYIKREVQDIGHLLEKIENIALQFYVYMTKYERDGL